MKYIIFLSTLLSSMETLPDFTSFEWNNLFRGDITVEYLNVNDVHWCRSYIESDYPIEKIATVLEDKASYPNVFDRITETILYTDDIVHIKLDMPFPWAGRDYIVKYTESSFEKTKEYAWMNYNELNIPVQKDYVRLIRAAGKWKLTKLENGNTQIEYIWNGELLGKFPSWALEIAWKEQGIEVLTWLIDYMDNK